MTSNTSKPSTRIYNSITEDCKTFLYKEPVVNKYKSRTAYINKSLDDQTKPRYQLASKDDPRLRAPYGISEPFDEKQKDSERKSLDLSIEFEGLLTGLKALDEHNVNVAFANCEKWFGKKLPIEHLRFMYKPLVTLDKTGKGYKPTFRTKVNLTRGTDNMTKFFVIEEANGKVKYVPKDSNVVTKGCRVVPVVEMASLWFSSTQFGMTLECTELIVFPGVQREEFPFQWGDDVPVPMEAETEVPPTNDPPTGSNDYVPPSSPHA
jgi:hypothetical protein